MSNARVILTAPHAIPMEPRAAVPAPLALAVLLPLFMQVFSYIVDLPPLYILAKAWPVLTLPLAMLGLQRNPRHAVPVAFLIAYAVTLPPMMSMAHFGQGYLAALTGTVKILPLTFYFSLGWLLHRLRPSPRQLESAFRGLGLATLLILAALWVLVPAEAYRSGAVGEQLSKLFLWEPERGYRITMPLGMAIVWIFLEGRTALRRGQPWRLAFPLAGLALLVTANKQRTAIAGAALTLCLGALAESPPRRRALLLSVGLLLGGALAALVASGALSLGSASPGGSLAVREATVAHAVGFLGANPLSWLLGVGSLTRASDVSFEQWFNDPTFYLADIGWLGIVFEYGAIGAAMLFGLYAVTWHEGRQTPEAPGGCIVSALGDYVLFMLLTSPILSVAWSPGEVCSILAIFEYLQERERCRA